MYRDAQVDRGMLEYAGFRAQGCGFFRILGFRFVDTKHSAVFAPQLGRTIKSRAYCVQRARKLCSCRTL